jgi:predicted permease
MIRSFHNLYTLDLGFAADRLVVFGMDLFGSYADDAMIEFVQQLELRASAIPGVQDAAVTTGVPPRDRRERRVEIDKPDAEPARFVSFVAITPRFFETVDVALLAGRNFEEADGQPGAEAVLVNERFAQDFFPGENPIGKRLRFVAPPTLSASADRPAESWRTIVGVTPTIRQGAIQDGYLNSVVYAPYRQEPDGGAYLLVRTSSSLAEVSDAIRSEVQSMDPDQPLRPGETLDQWMARDRWPYRVFGTLFAALAAIALTLSSIGIYAVMARAVTNRTQEIGVRMAVGAQERQIVWLVLRRGLVQLGVGLSLGLAGAAVSSLLMVDLLVGIRPGDPTTLAAIAILLSGVSILACLIPARHAARIDPQAALRPE